ncbi:hypothetical protein CLV80_101129 [Yoonia maritima]|uniref:Transferrin-binding protein B C-lobe/N-lobe beta barrel domain-containing protein n=2 Tax=Yoonia maritima TaxID=1435347 RepID=A0A2T0W482_9RHOB|nr:hypothetical protein CLV80_101129 [Yoonia maritima]
MLLAACGGGGGESAGSGIDPRIARIDSYDALNARVLGDQSIGAIGMSITPDGALPATGTAEFEGFATIRVENPDTPLVLYGDANVAIGFDDHSVHGGMDRFFGTNADGAVTDYSGGIVIDGGSVSDGLSLEYGGTLEAAGDTLTLSGTMNGAFFGDPVSAIAAADYEPEGAYNGASIDATVIIVGEGSGAP